VKKQNAKLELLSRELTKLITEERECLAQAGIKVPDMPIDLTNEKHAISRALMRWLRVNDQLNSIYKEKSKKIFWRKIPAMLEHSLTIHGPALSFLRAGIYYKALTLKVYSNGNTALDIPEKLTAYENDLDKLKNLFPAEKLKKYRLDTYRNSQSGSSIREGSEITITRDNYFNNIVTASRIAVTKSKMKADAEKAAEEAADGVEIEV